MKKTEAFKSATLQQLPRPRAVRRENGIYYSPEDVATALVKWAVRSADDTIFDPSFGGCIFLRAGVTRLTRLGASNAASLVYGTDWDQEAWGDAVQLFNQGADPRQFLQRDFLSVRPDEICGPFQVVVGNPPYVRAHRLSEEALSTARASLPSHVQLSKRASYWAYFVFHTLSFVAPGGRLALILPGTFLRADYASTIRSELTRAFASLTILALDEHLFPDAEEESVLVLAEQFGNGPGIVHIGNARRDGLVLDDNTKIRTRQLAHNEVSNNWARGLFDSETLALCNELHSRFDALGSKATIRIGVVTGRNDFFVVNDDIQKKNKIEDSALRPIIPKTAQLRSLWLTDSDMAKLPRLFVPPATDLPRGAARYIKYGEKIKVHEGYKCSQRSPWYVPLDTKPPDAFLSCMTGETTRLVLNRTEAVCTNTILAVSFQSGFDDTRRTAYAVGTLSTVAQLSAELEGRVSGGGLLKLEPLDARRLIIPPVNLAEKDQIHLDTLCRAGRWNDARLFVDDRLLGLVITQKELNLLTTALDHARTRRREYRNF